MFQRKITDDDRLNNLKAERDELEQELEQTQSKAKSELLKKEINRIDERIKRVRDELFSDCQ